MNHIKMLEKVIEPLSLGSCSLVQSKVNNKYETCIIIKDRLKEIIYSTDSLMILCKAALIKSGNVISSHIVIDLVNESKDIYYPFHFNYYNEESLNLVVSLSRQKKLYLILINELGECIELEFDNYLKKFFKKYIKRCINFSHQWNDVIYKNTMISLISRYDSIEEFWDDLGGEITLKEL